MALLTLEPQLLQAGAAARRRRGGYRALGRAGRQRALSLEVALLLALGAAAAAAAAFEPLPTPAPAFVALADGTRKAVAELRAAHAWALAPGGAAPAGRWCCVPIWNGKPETGELWAAIAGVGGGAVALSSDAACGSVTCAFPIAAVAYVNLCPGTAGAACAPAGGGGGGASGGATAGGGAANGAQLLGEAPATRAANQTASNTTVLAAGGAAQLPPAVGNASPAGGANASSGLAGTAAMGNATAAAPVSPSAVDSPGRTAVTGSMSLPIVAAADGREQLGAGRDRPLPAPRLEVSGLGTRAASGAAVLQQQGPPPAEGGGGAAAGAANATIEGPLEVTVLPPGTISAGAAGSAANAPAAHAWLAGAAAALLWLSCA
ncbi:MAG: hypothetical protein J3K34DRAFT_515823 [Monoraphidium minutum]|nr:MAG: hypothetical protein J3K34DRAFT_515823 [Monoraphidium minutum]